MTIAGTRPVWEIEARAAERGIKLAASAAPRESALAKEAAMRAWERLKRPVSAHGKIQAPASERDWVPHRRA